MNLTVFVRRIHTSFVRSTAQILNGVEISKSILSEVKKGVLSLESRGKPKPFLAVVLIGDDPGSVVYVKTKVKAAKLTGIGSKTYHLPSTLSQGDLLKLINELNTSSHVTGILVQRPLPEQIDEALICCAVLPSKDVDGFHPLNIGKYCIHQPPLFPCTALAVMEILKRSGIDTHGRKAVVCGRSKNVGLPIALHLCKRGNASTTILHKFTKQGEAKSYLKMADIIVTATGIPRLITADEVNPGACVVDVGFTRTVDPLTNEVSISGDCDFEEVKEVAGHITPVPGGVGPVTVAMLMMNTLRATEEQNPR